MTTSILFSIAFYLTAIRMIDRVNKNKYLYFGLPACFFGAVMAWVI